MPQQPAEESSAADAADFRISIRNEFLRRPRGHSANGPVTEPLMTAIRHPHVTSKPTEESHHCQGKGTEPNAHAVIFESVNPVRGKQHPTGTLELLL
jgi:hypothetical protein